MSNHVVGEVFLLSKILKRKTKRSNKFKHISLKEAQEIVINRKSIEGLRSETLRNYTKVFKHLNDLFGSDIDVKEISESDAKDFIFYLVENGISNSMINSYLHSAQTEEYIQTS